MTGLWRKRSKTESWEEVDFIVEENEKRGTTGLCSTRTIENVARINKKTIPLNLLRHQVSTKKYSYLYTRLGHC